MRWLWIAVAAIGLGIAFFTPSPGVLAVGLLLGFVGMFCAVFSIAADRIESTTRPETALLSPEVLASLRERRAQAEQANRAPAPPQAEPNA
jgi:hypothetical protein